MKTNKPASTKEKHAASRGTKRLHLGSVLLALALTQSQSGAAVPGTAGFCNIVPSTLQAQDATSSLVKFQSFSLPGGYVASGVGMRNRGFGHITISGIPTASTIYAAYLYWDILGGSEPDETFPQGQFNGQQIVGQLVAVGEDPCWGNANNFAYRANVTSLVSGNGIYSLTNFASGETDGSDPWKSGSSPPMAEGASLVVVYQNFSSPQNTILIYEGAALIETNLVQVTIDGFTVPNPVLDATTTFIVADGQQAELMTDCAFNTTNLPTITLNGNDPQDGPAFVHGNLWDTATTNVASLISPGDTNAIVTVGSEDDCLVWVAQVFSVAENPAGPALGITCAGTNAVLFWSTNASSFVLQTTTSLATTNTWSTVTDVPVIVGDCFYVTNAITNSARFYRLSQ